jgi:peptidoglycan/xylan/chitin deacetylase (PgdA/CDA1 family)
MRRVSAVLSGCLVAACAVLGAIPSYGATGADGGPSRQAQHEAAERLLDTGVPVYCGDFAGDAVALTFDDGPGPYTGRTLDLLRRFGARGTFFDVGKNVVRFPDLVRREAREGIVGDHTWSHPLLTSLGETGLFAQMARTKRAIERISGRPPAWLFRPPWGALDDRVMRAALTLDLLPVLWSVAPDVPDRDPSEIAAIVAAAARPGAIVLLHENRNHGATYTALASILSDLRAKGLHVVTVSELLASDPPSQRQLRTGPYACGPSILALSPAQGPIAGGGLITIQGMNLQLPQHVYFGDQPATSITPISPNEIHAVAPPGSGTVDVTVVTHFGASPLSTVDRFTYS